MPIDNSCDNSQSRKIRLYIDAPLAAGAEIAPNESQVHYLKNVMRCQAGAGLLVFNGRDGEWAAELAVLERKKAVLKVQAKRRDQTKLADIWLFFAPVKKMRLDFLVQKATEMGAAKLVPIMTQHTQMGRVNKERMAANAIEAAEQCGLLQVPEIGAVLALDDLLKNCEQHAPQRRLIFCDEAAPCGAGLDALADLRTQSIGVLVGPEGGFAPDEREALRQQAGSVALSLGPRILRTDTAAIAALAAVQMQIGDWT